MRADRYLGGGEHGSGTGQSDITARIGATAVRIPFPAAAMNREEMHGTQAWRDVFDAIAEPIFLHDREFRILRANRAYAEAADMPFREIIGRPYWQVFPKGEGRCPDARRRWPERAETRSRRMFACRTAAILLCAPFMRRTVTEHIDTRCMCFPI